LLTGSPAVDGIYQSIEQSVTYSNYLAVGVTCFSTNGNQFFQLRHGQSVE
jgi:hypothetical protein